MQLVTARLIVDRTNLQPVDKFTTTFNQDGVGFVLMTTRTAAGITVGLAAPGHGEPYEMVLDPEATPTEREERIAGWIVFVVDMTLVIRSYTHA